MSDDTMLFQQRHEIDAACGFSMPGFFVWGGSVCFRNGTYWMFASRWPKGSNRRGENILDGYRTSSEIVLATSKTAEGPYEFHSVVIGKRGKEFWDSEMAHNPYLIPADGKYVLFYIGSKEGNIDRKVGYAVADEIAGPYTRSNTEIALTSDANNPAPYPISEGKIAIMFRDRNLHVFVGLADRYDKSFEIVDKDIFHEIKLEDFCVYGWGGQFHMICEDNRGTAGGQWRWGVHYVSDDGIHNWAKGSPFHVYDHTIRFMGGTSATLDRRERPQLLFDDQGNITHLVTSALKDGDSRCLVVPVIVGDDTISR